MIQATLITAASAVTFVGVSLLTRRPADATLWKSFR